MVVIANCIQSGILDSFIRKALITRQASTYVSTIVTTMDFPTPLIQGTLINRHSRFLADVELSTGELITAHTSNTGAMLGCKDPGSIVWLSLSDNPKRKYAHTWEIIEINSSGRTVSAGINTMLSNKLVKEAISNDVIRELEGYDEIRTEVKYGEEKSRIDLLLESFGSAKLKSPCYVEVKNVTLVEKGIAYFPDAVSQRGSKHLRELISVAKQGARAVIFYCIQRDDATEIRPADHIDSEYGAWLRKAVTAGVEPLAYQAKVSNKSINLEKRLPVIIPNPLNSL